MPSDPLILAFDTSAAHCAAALLRGDTILATRSEDMTRGQAERLMPLLQDLLDSTNTTWRDLTAIGVGIGPGNFTGLRIAVSAARGLVLGLNIPAVGVSGCDARLRDVAQDDMVAITAPRDQVYLCDPANPGAAPILVSRTDASQKARDQGQQLTTDISPQNIAIAIARITATRWETSTTPPAPLYVRAVDAAPPRDKPPVLIA